MIPHGKTVIVLLLKYSDSMQSDIRNPGVE